MMLHSALTCPWHKSQANYHTDSFIMLSVTYSMRSNSSTVDWQSKDCRFESHLLTQVQIVFPINQLLVNSYSWSKVVLWQWIDKIWGCKLYRAWADEYEDKRRWQKSFTYFRRVWRIWKFGGDVEVKSFHVVTLFVANFDLHQQYIYIFISKLMLHANTHILLTTTHIRNSFCKIRSKKT